MQGGQAKEEPTLPYLLRYLPKYKAPGCVGIGTSTIRPCPLLLLMCLSMMHAIAKSLMGFLVSGELAYFTHSSFAIALSATMGSGCYPMHTLITSVLRDGPQYR